MTVSVFPAQLEGLSVDVVISANDWHTQEPEEIATSYLAAAIALVKQHHPHKAEVIPILGANK